MLSKSHRRIHARSRSLGSGYEPTGSFPLFWFFYAAFVFSEFAFRLDTGSGFFGIGLLFIFLFGIPTAAFATLLSSLWSPKGNRIASVILSIAAFLIFASQSVYHSVFKTFYVVSSVGGAGQVVEFWKVILQTILGTLFFLILYALPFVFLLCPLHGLIRFSFSSRRTSGYMAGLTVIGHVFCLLILLIGKNNTNSPHQIYYDATYSLDSRVETVGILNGFRRDVLFALFPSDASDDIQLAAESEDDPSVSLKDNEVYFGNEDSLLPGSAETPESETGESPAFTPNIMNIDFDDLIAKEDSKGVKTLHEYFSTQEPTYRNDHTGIFKGYNIIHITAEGFSPYCVDPNYTPTLYKMVHEGYNFTNYYCPIWGVSTSDGEYANGVGLVPKSGVWSYKQWALNDGNLYFCLGNQFDRLGYKTMAFHGHTYTYYGRDLYLKQSGYKEYYGWGNGLETSIAEKGKKPWPESDLLVTQASVPMYADSSPFCVYYMSISGHLEYNLSGNYQAYKHKDIYKDTPYSEAVRAYLACNYELELAMQSLEEQLEAAGIADKTLIVLSPDHYPYGLYKWKNEKDPNGENDYISEILGHQVEENFELYKSILIMYCKGMKAETVDTLCYSLDILPTISNLFGLEYDSRLLMGRDIFSTADRLVLFLNRSWITDLASYNAKTGETRLLTDTAVDSDYIDSVNATVKNKFTVSASILDLDYYNILFGN